MDLSCPQGQLIKITSANYGRTVSTLIPCHWCFNSLELRLSEIYGKTYLMIFVVPVTIIFTLSLQLSTSNICYYANTKNTLTCANYAKSLDVASKHCDGKESCQVTINIMLRHPCFSL